MTATILQHTTDHLVRSFGTHTAPAAGLWQVRSGQPVTLRTQGLRRREVPARVTGGRLIVRDDLIGSSLQLDMVSGDACIRLAADVTDLLAEEHWASDGHVHVDGVPQEASVRIHNNGVFRQRGRQPSLWLTIESAIRMPRRATLACELNLTRPEGQ
jgi:hypothetical protein